MTAQVTVAGAANEAGTEPGRLDIGTRWHDDHVVLSVAGDVNTGTAHVLTAALQEVGAGRSLELDLSAATFSGEPPVVRRVEAGRWRDGDSVVMLGAGSSVQEVVALRLLPDADGRAVRDTGGETPSAAGS